MTRIFTLFLIFFLLSCTAKKNENQTDSSAQTESTEKSVEKNFEVQDTATDTIIHGAKILGEAVIHGKFYLVYSKYIYEYPKEYDDSYYFEGIFMNSYDKENLPIRKNGLFDISMLSSTDNEVELGDICSHNDRVRINEFKIGNTDSSNFYILVSIPQCSDYFDHKVFRKQGANFKLIVEHDSHNFSANFKTKGDSIIYYNYTSRDEIVGAFQDDYYYEYNLMTGKSNNGLPDSQVIDWKTRALKNLKSYKSIDKASIQDTSESILIPVNTKFYMDTLYRLKKVLRIKLENNEIRYLNTENLESAVQSDIAG